MIVTFFGHSNAFIDKKLSCIIENTIIKLLNSYEFIEFYLGGYGNFDNACMLALNKLKSNYKNFKTIFVTPYILSSYDKLKNAKNLYDETIYPPIESAPLRFAIEKRNFWMVDNSNYIVFYVEKRFGGAYKCLKRAINKNIPFENISKY